MSEVFKRGQKLSDIKASELQKLVNTAKDYNLRFTVSPPLKLLHANGGGGMHLTWEANEGFWAQITDISLYTGACAWIEVVPKSDGGFEPRLNGRTGNAASSPAWPIPQGPVAVGIYVYLLAGWQHSTTDADGISGQEYLFTPPSLSGFFTMDDSTAQYALFLGRTITDAVTTAGSTTITSASANFQTSDEESQVVGPGLSGGRQVNDAFVTSGNATINSASANFTIADVGASVTTVAVPSPIPTGETIASLFPSGNEYLSYMATMSAEATSTYGPFFVQIGGPSTTLSSVTNSTTAELSQPATQSATNVTLTLAQPSQTLAYRGYVETGVSYSPLNDDPYTPVWIIMGNYQPALAGATYFGQLVGYDAYGVAIWGAAYPFPNYSAVALQNSDGSWTTQNVEFSPGNFYTAFAAYYFAGTGVESEPSQNCWLLYNNTGQLYGGTPFPNTMYMVYPTGMIGGNDLPMFITDVQAMSPVKTPDTFTDHPSEWATTFNAFTQEQQATFEQASPLLLGNGWYAFGALPGTTGLSYNFNPAGNIYVGAGANGSYSLYAGANGTDSAGSQFINGVCVNVGTVPGGGSPSSVDGGSGW